MQGKQDEQASRGPALKSRPARGPKPGQALGTQPRHSHEALQTVGEKKRHVIRIIQGKVPFVTHRLTRAQAAKPQQSHLNEHSGQCGVKGHASGAHEAHNSVRAAAAGGNEQ